MFPKKQHKAVQPVLGQSSINLSRKTVQSFLPYSVRRESVVRDIARERGFLLNEESIGFWGTWDDPERFASYLLKQEFPDEMDHVEDKSMEVKVVDIPEVRPYYLTTPIFYVNASPHLGHLYTMLIGDMQCRWRRSIGEPTFFMCGTDEHGGKVRDAALKNGYSDTQAFCDEVSGTFKNAWEQFGIQYDTYARTTSTEHKEVAQWMWQKLSDNGFIYKGYHSGWYCQSDETFVPEVQLVRQEDGSYKTSSGQDVTYIKEENYKFSLSKFVPLLKDYYTSNPQVVQPESVRGILNRLLEDGQEDISVSRLASKMEWGIDVPGDTDHKIYVWLDAQNIYLTGAKAAAQKSENTANMTEIHPNMYPNASNTMCTNEESRHMMQRVQELQTATIDAGEQAQFGSFWPSTTQVIGKDILKFHCIYWPAFLLAAGLPLPGTTISHAHWLVNGVKMSKSLGNVRDPTSLLTQYGIDNTRYALMRIGNIKNDNNLSDKDVVAVVNSELNDVLGNLYMRCTGKLLPSKEWPSKPITLGKEEVHLQRIMNEVVQNVDEASKIARIDTMIHTVMNMQRECNVYVNLKEPWKMIKNGGTQADVDVVLYHCFESVRIACLCLASIIPDSADKILNTFNITKDERNPVQFGYYGFGPVNRSINTVQAPFGKLVEEEVAKVDIPVLIPKESKKKVKSVQKELTKEQKEAILSKTLVEGIVGKMKEQVLEQQQLHIMSNIVDHGDNILDVPIVVKVVPSTNQVEEKESVPSTTSVTVSDSEVVIPSPAIKVKTVRKPRAKKEATTTTTTDTIHTTDAGTTDTITTEAKPKKKRTTKPKVVVLTE